MDCEEMPELLTNDPGVLLPSELWAHMASFLDASTVTALTAAIPSLAFLSSEVTVWRPIYERTYGKLTAARQEVRTRARGTFCWANEFKRRESEDVLILRNFNKIPSANAAFEYLVSVGIGPAFEVDRWAGLCKYLFATQGVSETKRGLFVCSDREPDLSYLFGTMSFAGMSFSTALRLYLSKFRVPGESQQIDRCVYWFAQEFFNANPNGGFGNADAAYVTAFACLMLNTDMHVNPTANTSREFAHFQRTMSGIEVTEPVLAELFADIRTTPLGVQSEHEANADAAAMAHLRRVMVLSGDVQVDVSVIPERPGRSLLAAAASSVVRVLSSSRKPMHAVLTTDKLLLFNGEDRTAATGSVQPQSMQVAVQAVDPTAADGPSMVTLRVASGLLNAWWGVMKDTGRMRRYTGAEFAFEVPTRALANEWALALNRTLNTRFIEALG